MQPGDEAPGRGSSGAGISGWQTATPQRAGAGQIRGLPSRWPVRKGANSLARLHNAEGLLLGKGVRVSRPRCSLCAKSLRFRRADSQEFSHASPILELTPDADADGAGSWLLVGTRALVARVNPQLAARFARSVAFLGDKVLVAIASNGRPLLFCSACATTVLSKLNRAGAKRYAWDWLVEFESRSRVRNKLQRIRNLLPRMT